MKKVLLFFMICITAHSVNAQVKTPKPSPLAKLEQKVGLTDVTLEYSRPGVKDRAIFGSLIPYGEIWRTGANKNTVISFSTDAEVDGQKLKAGSYAIFAKPGKENWDVYFYSDSENWGAPKKWDDAKVVAKTTAKVHEVPFNVETFTLDFNNIQNGGANLELLWEKTYIAIPFTVPTDDAVLTSINEVLGGEPSARDYYDMASYYLAEDKDPKQAKEWIDKAVDMSDKAPFYFLGKQAYISAKAGEIKDAIAAAEKSIKAAEKAGSTNYANGIKKSLEEWSAK